MKVKVKLVAGRTEALKCRLATAENHTGACEDLLNESPQNSQENSDQVETISEKTVPLQRIQYVYYRHFRKRK